MQERRISGLKAGPAIHGRCSKEFDETGVIHYGRRYGNQEVQRP